MEIKGPVPVVPAPVWRSFKDLQEWEALHQSRPPRGDTYSSTFEALTEGISLNEPMLIDYPTPAMPMVRQFTRGKVR